MLEKRRKGVGQLEDLTYERLDGRRWKAGKKEGKERKIKENGEINEAEEGV